MFKRTKLWTSISAITFVGASSLGVTACNTSSDNQTSEKSPVYQTAATNSSKALTESEDVAPETNLGEGEGEGEGASGAVDFATDDLSYLTQLGLMRGHLYVGNELFKAGHIEHAKMHMKHPESELYADVAPAFKARKSSGFAQELQVLTESVEDEKGQDAVAAAYLEVTSAISINEATVAQTSLVPAQRLKLVVELLRVAGEEYAIAVVDGEMQNAHEYQDALGFTTIATLISADISSANQEVLDAKTATLDILEGLKPLWPTLIPPQTLTTEAGALYGAAAKIELLALGIE